MKIATNIHRTDIIFGRSLKCFCIVLHRFFLPKTTIVASRYVFAVKCKR